MNLAVATLCSWLVSVSSGAVMLGTWIARGGPRQQRARREGLPPGVIIMHFSLALTGLALWISYLASGVTVLAFTGAALLAPVVPLGLSTLTLWTPFPVRAAPAGQDLAADPGEAHHAGSLLASPAEDELSRKLTDEVLAKALTDDALASRLAEEVLESARSDPARADRKSRHHLAPLIPALHGLAAITTILLALLTVVSTQ